MAKTNRRKPPSRVRYEQAHPTISCRVPRDVYNRLQAAKKQGSFANILKVGMGLIEAKNKDREEFARLCYEEGLKRGYAKAEDLYKVTYSCNRCGEMIALSSDNEKKAASQHMQENKWGHGECHKRVA